jgi:hypothetical protein
MHLVLPVLHNPTKQETALPKAKAHDSNSATSHQTEQALRTDNNPTKQETALPKAKAHDSNSATSHQTEQALRTDNICTELTTRINREIDIALRITFN